MKAIALLLLAATVSAAPIDDSDLSRPDPVAAARIKAEAAKGFKLSSSGGFRLLQDGERRITGRVVLRDDAGALKPGRRARVSVEGGASATVGDDGRFSLPAPAGASAKLTLSLDNDLWRFVSADGDSYSWTTEPFALGAGGADAGDVSPVAGSANDALGTLHLTMLDGHDFLGRAADARWWTRTLTVRFPGDSDHFEPWSNTLEISNALAWDVDLHELGHAVMHGAMRAAGAGGSHKIDECYSKELAWSEGWATFFAGAVRLSRGDADARFTMHLVPRRAPIRLENVPDDVCKGAANEWRVASALWDLYDTHADGGDGVSLEFSRVWQAARAGRTDGVASVWSLLEPRIDASEKAAAEASLIFNTVLPGKAAPRPLVLERHAAPRFDGAGR